MVSRGCDRSRSCPKEPQTGRNCTAGRNKSTVRIHRRWRKTAARVPHGAPRIVANGRTVTRPISSSRGGQRTCNPGSSSDRFDRKVPRNVDARRAHYSGPLNAAADRRRAVRIGAGRLCHRWRHLPTGERRTDRHRGKWTHPPLSTNPSASRSGREIGKAQAGSEVALAM